MKILLALFMFCSFKGLTQDTTLYGILPLKDGRILYSKVILVDSISKINLFIRLKDWAVDGYRSQKAALQSEDKDAGYLAYKGYIPTYFKYPAGILKGSPYKVELFHTLKFFIKDGRLKIEISDLENVNHTIAESSFNIPAERTTVESWQNLSNKSKGNKRRKIEADNRQCAEVVDKEVRNMIESVEKYLKKNKSNFDF